MFPVKLIEVLFFNLCLINFFKFIKKFIMSLIKLLFILTCNYYFVCCLNDTKCISNLECYDSACCRNNECVSNDTCKEYLNKIYVSVGIVGIFFMFATMFYFFISIKASRENVKKIKDGLKAASEE
jgi:hypothetical protein